MKKREIIEIDCFTFFYNFINNFNWIKMEDAGQLSARTMYEYDHHTNIPWNDP